MSFNEYYEKWKKENNADNNTNNNVATSNQESSNTQSSFGKYYGQWKENNTQKTDSLFSKYYEKWKQNKENQSKNKENETIDNNKDTVQTLSVEKQKELKEKLAELKNQKATVNQNGKGITNRENNSKIELPEIQFANKQYGRQEYNKEIESADKFVRDYNAQKTAEEINKSIKKGGADAVNATVKNTLNNFSEGVLGSVAGIANVPIMLGAGVLDGIEKINPKFDSDMKDNLLNEADRIGNKFTKYTNANPYIENNALKTSGSVSNTIGNMVPSIVSNLFLPGSGVAIQGLSVGGKTAEENLNANNDNIGESILKGTGYGVASGLIEKLTGGNILGKGSLDDFAKNFIKNRTSGKLGQKIASKGYEFLGENLEEFLENQVDHAIDYVIEEKKISKEEWLNEFNETNKNTLLTTAVLNLLGLGGNTYQEIQNDPNIDIKTKQAISDIDKAIEENNLGGNEQLEQFINNKIDNNTLNSQQQSIQPIPPINNNEINNLKGKSFEDILDEAMSNYENNEVPSPLQNRNINTIGKETKTNAYQYDNPEVKPYFQQMASLLGEDVGNIASADNRKTTKGGGTSLNTNISAIKQLKDMGYSYNQIIDGIVDIIDDHGKENNALSKKLEIIIDDQLRNGYTNSYGKYINPNKEYINLISNNNSNISNGQKQENPAIDTYNIVPTQGETINWNEIERPEGKIRKHYKSIIESSNTTAEAKSIAREMMGLDTYTPQSNESLLQKADSRISTTNPETELNSLLSRVMNNEKVNDVDIAVGERLIEYYSKIGDSEHLQDAIHTTALAGTQAGRTVQAMALLNHMTPQGQAVWLQRSIDKANNELQQKFKNKKNVPQFELTSEMTDKLLNTETREEMFETLDEIYEELGQQVPKTTVEKIDEWRYFSMLANIKTHGRNMIGNIAMNLTQRTKNKLAGAIEGTVAKFNPDMERTHTIVPTSKEVKQFAKNDVENMDVQTELGMNENKYNPQSRLQSARKTFKSDILNNTLGKLFDLNSNLLEVEDNIGLKSMYVNALGEYITANKIDINNISDAELSKARQHAIKEAQEATFHQASALATALNQMGRKNNIAKFALDSAVPFKKTPINVAKTGVQYSPVGLIKSAVYDVGKLRKGDISVNQYIDNVSKGLTGTGISYLGYALAEAGLLKASGSDDDKKEKYEEEQGKQSYSINIGGKTYSLDWLSPVGIPLFIGAEINQQFNNKKKEKSSKSNDDDELLNQAIQSVTNLANASANAMNPMSEMSMLSGLTSILSSYNKENALGNVFVNTGKSYVNQFVPTALGQLARTTDDYERTTKSTKTGTLEKAIDQTKNQIVSKIPGLRQTLPKKTDIWGKDIKQSENIPFRAFNNFINPSKVQDISMDKVDKELNSLYAKTGESSIIPKAIDKKYKINGTDYRMTDKEYAKYYKKYGETSYNLIKDLISSRDYKDLTDKQKQKAIEEIYSYAKENNKVDYANKNNIKIENNSTVYNTLEALRTGRGSQSSYLNYLAKTNEIEGEDANKKKIDILKSSGYTNNTKAIIYKNTLGKNDKTYSNLNKLTNVDIDAYLDYKLQDIKGDEDSSSNIKGKTKSGSKKQKVAQYLRNSKLSNIEKVYIYGKSYKLTASDKEILKKYMNKLTNEELVSICEDLTPNFEQHKDGGYYWK